MRDVDPVIMQDFFRDTLVLAKGQARRTAAGERQVLHFEKRNDVLIETGPVLKLFDEIEKNVGRTGLQFLPHKIDIVVDGEMLRGMTEFPQRGKNRSEENTSELQS